MKRNYFIHQCRTDVAEEEHLYAVEVLNTIETTHHSQDATERKENYPVCLS